MDHEIIIEVRVREHEAPEVTVHRRHELLRELGEQGMTEQELESLDARLDAGHDVKLYNGLSFHLRTFSSLSRGKNSTGRAKKNPAAL